MRYFTALSTIVVALLGTVAQSEEHPFQIQNCPQDSQVVLSANWEGAEVSPSIVAKLSANPSRKTVYSMAYSSSDGSWVALGALGAVVQHQGVIPRAIFEQLKQGFFEQANDPSPELTAQVTERVRNLMKGAGIDGNPPSSFPFATQEGPNSFTVLYSVFSDSFTGIAAQKHFYLNGCMALAQFAFPQGSMPLDNVLEAVSVLELE